MRHHDVHDRFMRHKKAQTRKGPFHSEIMAVTDAERQHDLKELEYLADIAPKDGQDMLDRVSRQSSPRTAGAAGG